LESGWGRSTLRREDGSNGFNLFGIKATPSWKGDHVSVPTLEYEGGVAVRRQAAFRAYGSYAESFQDYVSLVRDNPRYARALERAADPQAYMRELQAAGYATDPAYAEKVIRIWESQLGGLTVARR
ncbi:MAG: glucosaminidase domain-containing protein, partial [Gammaproteobacteria bacterium]|nr:glucosaminidase domain-containing protein [Gammaproteobacteria bacterium]